MLSEPHKLSKLIWQKKNVMITNHNFFYSAVMKNNWYFKTNKNSRTDCKFQYYWTIFLSHTLCLGHILREWKWDERCITSNNMIMGLQKPHTIE